MDTQYGTQNVIRILAESADVRDPLRIASPWLIAASIRPTNEATFAARFMTDGCRASQRKLRCSGSIVPITRFFQMVRNVNKTSCLAVVTSVREPIRRTELEK